MDSDFFPPPVILQGVDYLHLVLGITEEREARLFSIENPDVEPSGEAVLSIIKHTMLTHDLDIVAIMWPKGLWICDAAAFGRGYCSTYEVQYDPRVT